ncbi:DUF1801 domain-containing protein [Pseudoalteromonas xiamenensis]
MNRDVEQHFANYPEDVGVRLGHLREMVIELANELKLGDVTECLKWGEPSFSVSKGSPFRMDWKASSPTNCFLFFHCQTRLVETFKEVYGTELVFQGNRAIILNLAEPWPVSSIRHCVEIALTYHQRKHLPLLGM